MYGWDTLRFAGFDVEFEWIFMIVFWVVLLVGAIVLVRWLVTNISRRDDDYRSRSEKSAEDILRERYARGEIQREEFLQRLGDLQTRRKAE